MLRTGMSSESPARRPRGRPLAGAEPVRSREDYLAAALEAFADLGFEGSSVREIARHMGVSHGLIHAKFGPKQALWDAALDFGLGKVHAAMATAEAALAADATHGDRLRGLFAAFLSGLAEAPAILKLINQEGARSSDRLDKLATRFLLDGRSPIAQTYEAGLKAGTFRKLEFGVVFFLLAHGGGALVALGPLAEKLGMPVQPEEELRRRRIAETADLLVRAISA